MNTAPHIHKLHEADLGRTRRSGHRLRARCPIHGSDHQYSLDIECEGDAAGYGRCHSCGAVVFVFELATPEAAERMRSGERAQARPRTAQDIARGILRRAQRRAETPAERPAPAVTIGPELAQLRTLDNRMRARLEDERALAYLAARRIPLDVAQAYGVGYIPADARLAGDLARWRDRVMFPLGAPGIEGPGYIGRSLWGWTPEAQLDELAHKALLEGTPGAPPRWLKTQAPAGWFNFAALEGAETAVIVEGGFDALALLAACIGEPVVALAGTAARVDWIPPCVRRVVLALDGDTGGQSAAATLADDLRYTGVTVARCAPPDDGLGKDWAARWARSEWDGLTPIYDALTRLDSMFDSPSIRPASSQHRPASGIHAPSDRPAAELNENQNAKARTVSGYVSGQSSPVAVIADAPEAEREAGLADLWTLARADPVVTLLEAHGYALANVYAVPA